jgi:hypothetical protein
MNTIFLPSNVQSVAFMFRDSLRNDIHFQNEKWGGPDSTGWKTNITSMLSFTSQRPANARNFVQSEFGLNSQVTLTLQVSPAGAGRIQISTISPTTYPWNGVYFNGNPVTITAIPNPGYSFDHWRSNNIITTNNPNQSVTYNFTSSDVITCYFNGSAVTPSLFVTEINYNSDSSSNAGDWIELHNAGSTAIDISNWKFRDGADNHVYNIPVSTSIPANGYLVLSADLDKFQSIHPSILNVVGSFGFDFSNLSEELRLFDHNDNLYTSLTYADYIPWPSQADGDGYTLERRFLNQSADDPNNWFAGCLNGSPGRAYTSPAVNISPASTSPLCQGETTVINANAPAGSTYQWMRNNVNVSSATLADITVSTNGTYKVKIISNGCSAISDSVVVTFLPVENITNTTNNVRCQNGTVNLSASSTSNVQWYDDSTANNLLFTGNNFTTPVLSQTTTFYVQASGQCNTGLFPVTATIVASSPPPIVINATSCGVSHVTLTAVDTAMIYWYDSFIGGTLLDSGSTFQTPLLSDDSVFYAQSGNYCPGDRAAAHVDILQFTSDPVVSDVSRCGDGILTLTSNSVTTRWYDAINGSLLFTGDLFTTPLLTHTTPYYLQDGDTCPSNHVMASAIINHVSADPVVSDISRCGPGELFLTASASDTIYWYDAAGGNLLGNGSIFFVPYLGTSSTFYARAGGGCPGNYVSLQAIINPIPYLNLGNDTVLATGGFVLLDAGTGFSGYLWNTSSTSHSLLVNTSGIYFVTITDNNGCENSDTLEVNIMTGIKSINNESISFYPNPSKGSCSLLLPSISKQWNVRLMDASGKILFTQDKKSGLHELNLESFATGIYFLHAVSENSTLTIKVVRE